MKKELQKRIDQLQTLILKGHYKNAMEISLANQKITRLIQLLQDLTEN